MCGSIISEDLFSIRHVPYQYKNQQMCDKAVDDCLAALKLILDWFVTTQMIKKLLINLQTKVYSVLMKILVVLYLIVIEWIF